MATIGDTLQRWCRIVQALRPTVLLGVTGVLLLLLLSGCGSGADAPTATPPAVAEQSAPEATAMPTATPEHFDPSEEVFPDVGLAFVPPAGKTIGARYQNGLLTIEMFPHDEDETSKMDYHFFVGDALPFLNDSMNAAITNATTTDDLAAVLVESTRDDFERTDLSIDGVDLVRLDASYTDLDTPRTAMLVAGVRDDGSLFALLANAEEDKWDADAVQALIDSLRFFAPDPEAAQRPSAASLLEPAAPAVDKIVFVSSRDDDSNSVIYSNNEIYRMNSDGSQQERLTNNAARNNTYPAWSPDGTRIAFSSRDPGSVSTAIFLMNAEGVGRVPLTDRDRSGFNFSSTWSPDGTRIAFSDRVSFSDIYVMNADGSDPQLLLPDTEGDINSGGQSSPVWSPDGTRIAFVFSPSANEGEPDIYVVNADGTDLQQLTDHEAGDSEPAWSPDGERIAFVSNRDGDSNDEIYVMNADGSDPQQITPSEANDNAPAWSPDGTRIVFDSDRNRTPDSSRDIYVMDADGSNVQRLTTEGGREPDWSWATE